MKVVQGKGLQAHLGLLPFPQGLEVKCSRVGPEKNFLAPGKLGRLILGIFLSRWESTEAWTLPSVELCSPLLAVSVT